MKKIRTKRKQVDYLQQQKRQKINANIRDDLLLELDNNIKGFRDIKWISRSKKFDTIKDVKYELLNYITDAYYGHLKKHRQNKDYYSLYYKDLEKTMGKKWRNIITIAFDIKYGAKPGSVIKDDGLTYKYRLKKEVMKICDKVFAREYKIHGLIGRDGKKIISLPEYVVGKINDGELVKKVDSKKYQFRNVVSLSQENIWLMCKMWGDLYKHKRGKKVDVKHWRGVLNALRIEIRDISLSKLERLHQNSLELMSKTSVDIIGEGRTLQLYTEKDSGRLYGDGWLNLQTMPKMMRYIAMGGKGYYEYDMENAHYNILYQYNRYNRGPGLDTIGSYVKETERIRKRLGKAVGVDISLIKKVLISMVYGASINTKHRYNDKKNIMEDGAIYGDVLEYTKGNRKEADELFDSIATNVIVRGLEKDIQLGFRYIKKSWKTKFAGEKERLYNHANKPIRLYEFRDKKQKWMKKSRGKVLAHFIQGLEAVLLWYIMEEEQQSFIMPHHDGWVSTMNWDTKRLENILNVKSAKLLNDYNGMDGGFKLKLKKVKLGEVMMGDWKDLLLKDKGVGVVS